MCIGRGLEVELFNVCVTELIEKDVWSLLAELFIASECRLKVQFSLSDCRDMAHGTWAVRFPRDS